MVCGSVHEASEVRPLTTAFHKAHSSSLPLPSVTSMPAGGCGAKTLEIGGVGSDGPLFLLMPSILQEHICGKSKEKARFHRGFPVEELLL